MKPRRGHHVAVLSLCSLTAVLLGCGGNAASPDVGVTDATAIRPAASTSSTTVVSSAGRGERLTTAQALKLSRMLLLDGQAGGADVSVVAPAGTMARFEMEGSVDWRQHHGSVTVRSVGPVGSDSTRPDEVVVWANANVVIAVPGLGDAMAVKGRPGVQYASRPLQAGATTLDQVIVLIASLASDRAENPILLRQADTGYLGNDTIDGVVHERFRYGKTVYWVNSDGRIGRVEATLKTTASPVTIDLRSHGPRNVAVPDASSVVAAAEIGDVLAELARR